MGFLGFFFLINWSCQTTVSNAKVQKCLLQPNLKVTFCFCFLFYLLASLHATEHMIQGTTKHGARGSLVTGMLLKKKLEIVKEK